MCIRTSGVALHYHVYIYINHIVGSSVCMSVCMYICMSTLNLRGFKSHDHETWHVGPLSDLDVHGSSVILIFGRIHGLESFYQTVLRG